MTIRVIKTPKFLGLALAACLASSVVTAAPTGKSGEFTIHNDTNSNTVVGFYTNDGTGWSTNWLSRSVAPGDTSKLEFTKDGALCQQRLIVGWKGKNGGEVKDEPIRIDFCKASNVYLHDLSLIHI